MSSPPGAGAAPPTARRRTGLALGLIVAGALALGLACAAVPLGALAVYYRVLPPPAFAVQFGRVEFAAPCPPSEFACDEYPAFFALWRSDPQPDGSVRYRQLWFVYLHPKRPR